MASIAPKVPERISWAVELLDVAPGDQILELGCGPGVAVALLCDRLDGGQVTGIDRSATAIDRATARNAEKIAAGRAVLDQVEIADLPGRNGLFDKVFAINVNVFWTGAAEVECAALARVLRPGGTLRLIYAGPAPGSARDVGPAIAAKLERFGFAGDVTTHPSGAMACITGGLPR